MTTITLSMPERFNKVKEEFPLVDWNEVVKSGIFRRLKELEKFEDIKNKGEL